jgi:dolichol-phosphate mannosyltransferase
MSASNLQETKFSESMVNVTVIIPMFNEEESLPQLFAKLRDLRTYLSDYKLCYIFVDDGSTDRTHELSMGYLSEFSGSQLLRHPYNKNLGAALKTGIKALPPCDFVCFLDSDCTYEPRVLKLLLEALGEGADLATVSPYHPEGLVEGVPAWRLGLSKVLTALYRFVLNKKIYTFTAMVRAVKADKVKTLINQRNDFTFIAIGMIQAIRSGLKIAEVPATLHVRRFGVSKMKITKTIFSHIFLILKIIFGKTL